MYFFHCSGISLRSLRAWSAVVACLVVTGCGKVAYADKVGVVNRSIHPQPTVGGGGDDSLAQTPVKPPVLPAVAVGAFEDKTTHTGSTRSEFGRATADEVTARRETNGEECTFL